MGDTSMGLAYLCSCCCCFQATDPGPEGSQRSRSKKHPKEKDIKNEFMKRDYRKDKDGIIRFNSASVAVQPERQIVMREQDGMILRDEGAEIPARMIPGHSQRINGRYARNNTYTSRAMSSYVQSRATIIIYQRSLHLFANTPMSQRLSGQQLECH
ncbi:hypothetical protein BT96DRAFT_1013860 [Gymnopus androsaceus JB14]|uniref:Uncharacterized protein n=1 Tax=Gymnopus androsaceus JB14 TaxID=1447944 RepID=A0A6A4IE37_9AGAR|nr:hypothetical protein BT96DRAFT_1013860 [Gymnopus androsaceus JB14]